ncbi:MAG: hypothetical protein KIT58_22715 [Planctomycetota bacterium]|nr:hypothetical protein [Planctomycetota bacterium]
MTTPAPPPPGGVPPGTYALAVGVASGALGALGGVLFVSLLGWSPANVRPAARDAAYVADDDGEAPAGAVAVPALVDAPPPAPAVGEDGAWPPERDVRDVAVKRADALEVLRVQRILTDDPFWGAWRDAPYVEVPLMAQQMAMPRLDAPSIDKLRVQGLCDGRQIAWRIGWDDATPDGNVDVSRFSDAVAIAFPLDPGAPPMMGSKERRVQILYWKALWQKDIDAGFQDVQALHPNYWTDLYWFAEGQFPYPVPSSFQHPASRQWFIAHQAGNPMAAFSRSQPVEELVAEGWSTLTHQPHSATSGRGAWVQGKWAVVLRRPLKTTDPLDYTFTLGGTGQASFAAWNGSAGERGGRKHWSSWVDFVVKP